MVCLFSIEIRRVYLSCHCIMGLTYHCQTHDATLRTSTLHGFDNVFAIEFVSQATHSHPFSFFFFKNATVSSDEEADDDGIPEPQITDVDYVPLTTHSEAFGVDPIPISWGHPDPTVRGPIICTVRHNAQKNAIGAHAGQYCIYTG